MNITDGKTYWLDLQNLVVAKLEQLAGKSSGPDARMRIDANTVWPLETLHFETLPITFIMNSLPSFVSFHDC